jgi:hypothetical protein
MTGDGDEFEFGLGLILDGLEQARTPPKKTTRKPATGQPRTRVGG